MNREKYMREALKIFVFYKKRRPYINLIYNENKSCIFYIPIVVELQDRTNSLEHLLSIYSKLVKLF